MDKKVSARTMWIVTGLSLLFPIAFIPMLIIAIHVQMQENKQKKPKATHSKASEDWLK